MVDLKGFRKNNLKKRNGKNTISQEVLAQILDVSQSNISMIENGTMEYPEAWTDIISKEYPDIVHYITRDIQTIEEPKTNYRSVPYIGQEITATASRAMADALPISNDTYFRLPMFMNADFVLPVVGHSMKGYIDHGDTIAVRKITNKNLIIYGEPYVVITRETNMRTVKFVNQDLEDDSKLWLSPYNTEQFNSQSISKDDILEMYVVLGKLKNFNI